jgi:SAM-dependent methyltransferase
MNIPAAYGYLNFAQTSGPDVYANGWILGLDGPFDTLQLFPENGAPMPVEVYERRDLADAIPHVPNAERGSFQFHILNARYDETGTFRSVLVGSRHGSALGSMTIDLHRVHTDVPFPPAHVMTHAAGNTGHEFWFATGMKDCNDFRRCLAPHVDLGKIASLLDWGCGAGRVTRHLIDRFPGAVVHGADIDQVAVEWAASHLRGTFSPCTTNPPLSYGDASFDLIVSLSVFTHLTKDYQARWLAEIRRILKPGGLLLATTHGPFAGRWIFPDKKQYLKIFGAGFNDSIEDNMLGEVASGAYYRSTFQTYEYTRTAWSPFLDFVDYIEGGCHNLQDIFVWKKAAR